MCLFRAEVKNTKKHKGIYVVLYPYEMIIAILTGFMPHSMLRNVKQGLLLCQSQIGSFSLTPSPSPRGRGEFIQCK
jgi:hypothetical protein